MDLCGMCFKVFLNTSAKCNKEKGVMNTKDITRLKGGVWWLGK